MSTDHTDRRTVLKTAAGVVASTAAVTALSGSAAAHFPRDLDVDVTPGTEQNAINPRSDGVTTVAVLSNESFDPTSEEIRYRFGPVDVVEAGGGATPVRHRERDVNDDGREDLVLQFRTDRAGVDGDESEAELRWDRDESREHGLSGRDEVTVVGR